MAVEIKGITVVVTRTKSLLYVIALHARMGIILSTVTALIRPGLAHHRPIKVGRAQTHTGGLQLKARSVDSHSPVIGHRSSALRT